jgi:hypothetical protein
MSSSKHSVHNAGTLVSCIFPFQSFIIIITVLLTLYHNAKLHIKYRISKITKWVIKSSAVILKHIHYYPQKYRFIPFCHPFFSAKKSIGVKNCYRSKLYQNMIVQLHFHHILNTLQFSTNVQYVFYKITKF